MGDARYRPHYERILRASNRPAELAAMEDEHVIAALAAASGDADPFLANVLATEALNRIRRARAAFLSLGEGVIAVDLHEGITFANPAAETTLGFGEGRLVGRDLHDLLHPERARSDCTLAHVMATATACHTEEECFVRADGTTFPVAYTASAVLADDMVIGGVIVFEDIRERKEAEAALRESEERYQKLAEATSEPVVIHDGSRVLDVNRAAEKVFRIPREEAIGLPVLEFVAPCDHGAVRRAISNHDEGPYEVDCVRRDGDTFHAQIVGRTIAHRGRTARVVVVRDLSEQVRLAQGLREREEWYRSIFLNNPQPILSIDIDGRVRSMNEACRRLMGWDPAQLEGRPIGRIVAPEDRAVATETFRYVLRGEVQTRDLRVLRQEGAHVVVRVTALPIVVAEKVVGVHAVMAPPELVGP